MRTSAAWMGAMSLLALACGGVAEFPEPVAQSRLDLSAPAPTFAAPIGPEAREGALRWSIVRRGGVVEGPRSHWLYLPSPPEQLSESLPVVLIAASGSDTLHGMGLAELAVEEHLPYVEAGFAVIAYELTGAASSRSFDAAQGGAIDARDLHAWALEQPWADPERVFAVGYGSAGEVALLYASQVDTLAGVVAYSAPGGMGCWNQAPGYLWQAEGDFDDLVDFCQRTSARNYVGSLATPALLYGLEGDLAAAPGDIRAYGELAPTATVTIVPMPETYGEPSIFGIPQGVAWMKER